MAHLVVLTLDQRNESVAAALQLVGRAGLEEPVETELRRNADLKSQ